MALQELSNALAWWRCPTGRCVHAGVMHEHGEAGERPCMIQGCGCGWKDLPWIETSDVSGPECFVAPGKHSPLQTDIRGERW